MEALAETEQCVERARGSSVAHLVGRGLALSGLRVTEGGGAGASQKKLVMSVGGGASSTTRILG